MTKRKADMLNSVTDYIHSHPGAGRREIAVAVGLKMTPYLYGLIDTVIQAGWARAEWDETLERPAFRYYPARPVELPAPGDYGV